MKICQLRFFVIYNLKLLLIRKALAKKRRESREMMREQWVPLLLDCVLSNYLLGIIDEARK